MVPKQCPEEQSTCRIGPSILPRLRAGDNSHCVGFSWRSLSSRPLWKPVRTACVASWDPLTVPSPRKKAVKSTGSLVDSECVRPSVMALGRARQSCRSSSTSHNIWAKPVATHRISRRKQNQSTSLKAFSESMVGRYRLPSLSCFRTRAVAGDWRRTSRALGLSARFSFSLGFVQKSSGPKAAPGSAKHLSCRTVHPAADGKGLASWR